MKKLFFLLVLIRMSFIAGAQSQSPGHFIQIVFTSDAHYGIARNEFRGDTNVNAAIVNKAMIEKINSLPGTSLPNDGGLAAAEKIKGIDYVIEGGDIANRMEIPVQSAAVSWSQFDEDYIRGIHLKNANGKPAQLLIIPGNHDISNAIGFYKAMNPPTDPSSMVQIYNLMMHPAVLKTNSTYNYDNGKVNYTRDIGGIHFMFINLWPDSLERLWMKKDLANISASIPVVIFAHDQPECEAKHFTNPDPGQTINKRDKFENLFAEAYKDSSRAESDGGNTVMEQKGWVTFLKQHPSIKAYFHGNTNFNEFYNYHGPDSTITLPVFRVDSPIKGRYSKKDESRLSFLLITIDVDSKTMTVRECLWNKEPKHKEYPLQWGNIRTIYLTSKTGKK